MTETTTPSGTQQLTSPTQIKQQTGFTHDGQTNQDSEIPMLKRWDTPKLRVEEMEKEDESDLTDYTYVYYSDTQPDHKQLNEMTQIDYEQDKTEWTTPLKNE
jgi:hypothetical protein